MVYFLFINAQNNKRGKNRFLFTPSTLNTSSIGKSYWLLPPITSEKNYTTIITKLINDIFGIKRVIGKGMNKQFIKSFNWDKKITEIKKPVNRDDYPTLFLLGGPQFKQVEDAVDKAENLEGKVLMVDIFYYLEKLNATQTEKLQGFCEYHKTMLASHLNVNRRTTLVYDEKQDKFIDKKEPIFSAILRSFMGNTQGGRRHNRTIKQKRKMNKTRRNKKSRKPRHTRRRK